MAITDWPAAERPREKLLHNGPEALSDAELLAIFLRTGTRGMTAVDLARRLLVELGGLRPLLEADTARISAATGLGPAKAAQLQAALEMARRHLRARMQRGDALRNPDDTRSYLTARLRDRHDEVFACVFLDNRHRVLTCEELFTGTINGAEVHPRRVLRRALTHNAAAVIFAHNHPSGVAEPSHSDRAITDRLRNALAYIDVRVLDHLVIGDGEAVSMAELGMLA